ncbi:MAG: hypothetical protein KF866_09790 [Phycisphaeraceae bacterium]|nr:hypothetical protein [Phycisphaeraceae bacterium]MCW5754790.1 hypothetical protein [Phycisphaeraceae bacterium]
MLPKPPPREGNLGFLYLPPYRIQGISVAGEVVCLHIPELDVCFDMGCCPRAALSARFAAISHGHMDHVGGLAYYCSQRKFQGMGVATIVCDKRIESDIRGMLSGFEALERQKTPYNLIALEPEQCIEVKNNIVLKGFLTEHTAPSMGYVLIERRSKLKEEFVGLPQEKLRELKDRGTEITRMLEIPLVAYLGDTSPGPVLLRDDVRKAQIILSECTFVEPEHKERAKIGMHMHLDDILEWVGVVECQAMVLHHISRRTNLQIARKIVQDRLGREQAERILFLMDHRGNKERYERQLDEAERAARAAGRPVPDVRVRPARPPENRPARPFSGPRSGSDRSSHRNG